MLVGVNVEHHVHERAHQSRATPAIDNETRTADLRATRQIENSEGFADFPVRLERCAVGAWRAPTTEHTILFLATRWHFVECQIGQLVQHLRDGGIGGISPRFERRDGVADRTAFGD